jgi:hypothetical protein
MSESDKVFAGSVPENYDRYLVPLIFERSKAAFSARPTNVRSTSVRSTGQCNTACSLSAGVSKPKVFRGR